MDTNQIYNSIKKIDVSGKRQNLSYTLTKNNKLENWDVMIPFGNYNTYPDIPIESVFSQNVKRAFDSLNLQNINNVEIDITNLYACTGDNLKALITGIVEKINKLEEHQTATIRLLVGSQSEFNSESEKTPTLDSIVEAFFNAGITHRNTKFYWGNYSVSIQKEHISIKPFKVIIDRVLNEIKTYSENWYRKASKIWDDIEPELETFLNNLDIDQFTWNHSKCLAINGSVLLTGGANFHSVNFEPYNGNSVINQDIYVEGDAAKGVHNFCNYLWSYLNNIPKTDKTSWIKSAKITDKIDSFKKCNDAPMFSDSPNNINYGDKTVLGVAQIGDWRGFPSQIFPAIRDFILNLFYELFSKMFPEDFIIYILMCKSMSDEDPYFIDLLNSVGIDAASWASRYSRVYSVKNAVSNIKLSQQTLIQFYVFSSSEYMDIINKINHKFNLKWDGSLWPIDLLYAMGYALSTMSHNTTSKNVGIEIICSFYNTGWKDIITGNQFKERLIILMTAMQQLGLINPAQSVSDLVNQKCDYRRTTANVSYGNHCKMFLVDDNVLYIGSDNAYPQYNEQYGLWIDDEECIKSFIENNWTYQIKYSKVG